jgi:transcriptional regulator with XRE-family HTH domain
MATGPTDTLLQRRRLAARLRELRAQAGLTLDDVAGHLGCTNSKVSKIERARQVCLPQDLRRMLELYDVAPEERAALEELAQRDRKAEQPWWRDYSDTLTERYAEFLSFEAGAQGELEYQTVLIPGLLQTERYALAVTGVGFESAGADQIDALVEVRMRRQQILTQDSPLQYSCVITQAALHFEVGGPQARQEQLAHLAVMADLPNVTIQVIPYSGGADGTQAGAFSIIQLGNGDPDVAFVESVTGSLLVEDPRHLRRLNRLYRSLAGAALPPDESLRLINRIRDQDHDPEEPT